VLLFALLPSPSALRALAAFHLFVLTAGTFGYLRTLGMRRLAATCAGALAAGAVLSWGAALEFPNVFGAVSWMPVLLLCFERAVRRTDWRWVALLAAAAALQWLSGFPDVPMDAAVLLITVAVLPGPGTVRRRVGMAAVGLLLGGALAAVQLLPLAEMVAQGARAGDQHQFETFRTLFRAVRPGELLPNFWRVLGLPSFALAGVALAIGPRLAAGGAAAFMWSTFALYPPFSLLYMLPPFRARAPPSAGSRWRACSSPGSPVSASGSGCDAADGSGSHACCSPCSRWWGRSAPSRSGWRRGRSTCVRSPRSSRHGWPRARRRSAGSRRASVETCA
jgi:hypothetical protein